MGIEESFKKVLQYEPKVNKTKNKKIHKEVLKRKKCRSKQELEGKLGSNRLLWGPN